ncbi:MAG: carbohydrate-binding domain-containing protein [Paludibacteraceae bacterium]|nr:carbohydrate-binding domain-containing protein [Paludibacteraceae bacterium]
MKKTFLIFTVTLLCLCTCERNSEPTISVDSTTTTIKSIDDVTDTIKNDEDLVENTTFSTDVISITYNGSSATITNPWEGKGVEISNDNGTIVCTSTADERIEYIISGNGTGSLKIYSEKKLKLSLNDLTLSNANGPAINLQGKKRQFVVLSGTNTLTGKGYDTADGDEQAKATIFSEGQIIISGSGSLNITSNGKHGIASDDYVRICNGDIVINATNSSACGDGINCNDGFIMDDGTLSINAYDEGIQSGDDDDAGYCYITGGTLHITVQNGDGIKSYGNTLIHDGNISITATGSNSEGLESKAQILIEGGQVEIESYDDGINASTLLTINGGWVYAKSNNNDAIDSNGDISISGGVIVAIGSRDPETAFDIDEGTLSITGGTILSISPNNNMFVYPSTTSTQYSIWTTVNKSTTYNISNSTNDEAINFETPSVNYTPKVLVSSPLMTSGNNTLTSGVTLSGGTNWHGLYIGATHNGGSSSTTINAQLGSANSQSGGPGGPGGRP